MAEEVEHVFDEGAALGFAARKAALSAATLRAAILAQQHCDVVSGTAAHDPTVWPEPAAATEHRAAVAARFKSHQRAKIERLADAQRRKALGKLLSKEELAAELQQTLAADRRAEAESECYAGCCQSTLVHTLG